MNDTEILDTIQKYWEDSADCEDYHYFLEGLRDVVEVAMTEREK